ncbi:MAG: FAD-binding oxidoreductase [Gammaproteobacteria bacterium]
MSAYQKHYAGDCSHTGSYYEASANAKSSRDALAGEHECEICVVGGGYSGLSTALHLVEKGHGVTLIEGARIGWGASGRNGGQIVNGLNASLGVIEKRYGNEFASFVGKLVQEGSQIIHGNIKKYNIQCDLKEGNLFAAYTEKHLRELRVKQKLWRRHGMNDHEMVSKEEMRGFVGSDVYSGGMIDKTGGHIHPLNLALGEASAIESNGGKIFEMTRMESMQKSGKDIIVKTDNGTVRCNKLVICGNAYLGKVIPQLTSRVMPVSTQIIATKPLGDDLANEILPTDICVEDVRYILDYYRLSADKRLLFGGGTVYGGSDPKDVIAKLRPSLEKVFPQLKGIEIDYAWSGNFALSFSRVPQMGRLGNNVYFAHGYSGHGVTGSHLFGRILSEAIDNDTKRFDEFSKVPWIPFPGGRTLRVPYSIAGSWWYGLRDTLGL